MKFKILAALFAVFLAAPVAAQDETIDDLRVGEHLRLQTINFQLLPPCGSDTAPMYSFADNPSQGIFCFPGSSMVLQSEGPFAAAGRSSITLGDDFAQFGTVRAEDNTEYGMLQLWDQGGPDPVVSIFLRQGGAFHNYRFYHTHSLFERALLVQPTGTAGARPACSVAERGKLWPIQNGAGVADQYEVCQKDAADAYAWRELKNRASVSYQTIWAEENAALGAANTYEWAFGNGANTPVDGGIAFWCPAAATCEVVAMGLTIRTGTATVELVVNGTPQGAAANVTVTGTGNGVNTLGTPLALASGDLLNFRTTSSTGATTNANVVSATIRVTE